MSSKHCAHGTCNSDTRFHPDKKFAKFPQPAGRNPDIKRCKQWITLIRRQNFTIENINKNTWVCEDHFEKGVNLDYLKARKHIFQLFPVDFYFTIVCLFILFFDFSLFECIVLNTISNVFQKHLFLHQPTHNMTKMSKS